MEKRSDYRFRFRFKIDDRYRIFSDNPSQCVPLDLRLFFVHSRDAKTPIHQCGELVLEGSGCNTEDEAQSFGEQSKVALMLTGAYFGIGIDLGRYGLVHDTPINKPIITLPDDKNILEEKAKSTMGSKKRQLIEDNDELMIYDRKIETRWFRLHTPYLALGEAKDFLQEVIRAFRFNANLNEKERLALELYHLAQFEYSAKTRFLVLVMAIESLLEEIDEPDNVKEHLDRLILITEESETKKGEFSDLIKKLEWGKYKAIERAGREFVKKRLGSRKYADKRPSVFFTECYGIRSQIVHSGEAKDTAKMVAYKGDLNRFVADILLLGVNANYQSRSTDISESYRKPKS